MHWKQYQLFKLGHKINGHDFKERNSIVTENENSYGLEGNIFEL